MNIQDLIEAVKNDDLKTVEHILQKEGEITTSIDARESDKVLSINPMIIQKSLPSFFIDFKQFGFLCTLLSDYKIAHSMDGLPWCGLQTEVTSKL